MRVMLGMLPFTFDRSYPGKMNRKLRRGYGLIQGPTPHLGSLLMCATLKKAGHEPLFFDGVFNDRGDFEEKIRAWRPHVLGAACTTAFWDLSKQHIQNFKRLFPDLTILAGGPHINIAAREAMEECPEIDVTIRGDGEFTVCRVMDALEQKRGLAGIPGVMFRAPDGRIVDGGEPEYIDDLDKIPFPDYDQIDVRRYAPSIGHYKRLPNITMVMSRGCPFQCTFCLARDDYRAHSPEYVLAHMDLLAKKYGVRDILLYDEDLLRDPDWMAEICEQMIARKIDLTWSGNARPAAVTRPMLRLMKRAGCWKLLYGLETGSEVTMAKLNKTSTLEDSRRAVEDARSVGIRIFGTFMFGTPGETYQEALKTIDFACSLTGVDFAKFLNYTPWPGTDVYKNIEQYGRITDLSKMTLNQLAFIPHSMTTEEMMRLYTVAYRRFYRRPSYILRRAALMRSFEDFKMNVRGFLAFVNAKQECKEQMECDV